jgi:hypothetical protein
MKNPSLLLNTKTMLAAVALTGLMVGSAARVQASTGSGSPSSPCSMDSKGAVADDSDSSKGAGKNSCKGKGGCKTGDNGCKGKNTCKGKGGCKTNGMT